MLSSEEVDGLLAQCSSHAPTGVRNRALIAVLYRGGLRVREALALRTRDIDRTLGTLTICAGNRERVVGIDAFALSLVQDWLDIRRGALRIGPRSPVFCTLEGRALRDNYLRTTITRLARRAGIEKRVHPNGLRRTHAVKLVAEGTPVAVIQQQLGHATLGGTERYLREIEAPDGAKAMQTRQWRSAS